MPPLSQNYGVKPSLPVKHNVKDSLHVEGEEVPPLSSTPPQNLATATTVPYSVFSSREKWLITILAACAGFFSPLASNIYFPAIPTLASAFGESTQRINLTVTVYFIVQGIAPTLWGTVADAYGRRRVDTATGSCIHLTTHFDVFSSSPYVHRPVYLASLSVFILACVGLALTPTSAYWLLMLLRCLSAFGSAVVIALGAGTVGDIAPPSERGTYMGVVLVGPMFGPCIGPVFGGLLNQNLGWRSIFWFLVILCSCVLVPFSLWFPETLPRIVGNGGIPAHGINRTLWDLLKSLHSSGNAEQAISHESQSPREKVASDHSPKRTRSRADVWKDINPLIALRYLLEKDVAIVLMFNALNNTAFYAVTTTLSTLLESSYGLSTSLTGVCYLPVGLGAFISAFATGKLLDRDFRITKARLQNRADAENGDHSIDYFPIERARLRTLPVYCLMYWVNIVVYGWLIQYRIHLAAPLVFQFFIGYGSVAIVQVSQTLSVDLFPSNGASITADNNLCRNLLSAVGTAIVGPMIAAIRPGFTMMIFVAVCVTVSPLMILEWRSGMKWRTKRMEKVFNV